jgi:RNA 2',3'-cyclic 3'-phosphodiesterase
MRTFIAIELPQNIKNYLAKIQQQLKGSGADVKWVEPGNIHLTLKFLGERDEKKIKAISAVIENVALGNKSFTMSLSSIGTFPSISSPRVIWIGIDIGDAEVKKIVANLEEEIAKQGIPKEDRAFSSHITIGRTRTPRNKEELTEEIRKITSGWNSKGLEFHVTKITLFKSTLSAKGPAYEVLKAASLKAS